MPEINPTSLNCPNCGAPLDYDGTSAVIKCKFCRNISVVPELLHSHAGGLDEIRGLVNNGDIAGAIQKYRDYFGAGLKDAKDAVEALRARVALPHSGETSRLNPKEAEHARQ